jgi:hypothetical protein
MKAILPGIVGALLVALVGCGGGGGGGSNDCGDVATKVNKCSTDNGGTADPTIKAQCDAVTCTGSKQAAIDCIMGLACNASLETASHTCLTDNGCTTPP